MNGEFAVAFSKPEPQVSYLRELLLETTASQLWRVAVRRAPRQAISVDRAFAIANVLGVEMTELFTAFPAVPQARPY